MQRVVDEAEYVLALWGRMRDEVSENPELYDPDAQERKDEALASSTSYGLLVPNRRLGL